MPHLCVAQNPPEQPSVRIRNAVRMVEVDVIAKDRRGSAVTDLEAKDFKLFDNGQAQEVTHLRVERPAFQMKGDAPDATLSVAPIRTFSNTRANSVATTVILLDLLNTAAEDQASMKTELMKSLDHLKEGTQVALLILGDDLTVVSDFTESTVSLKQAAENQFHLRAEGFGPSITARATGNPVRDQIILKAASQAFHSEDRERGNRTISALNLICDELARIPGRKSLVWITSGLTVAGQSHDVEDAIDRFNDSNIAVYTIDARGVLLDAAGGAEIDTNDMTAPMSEERQETRANVLATMSAGTGGVFYHNKNRLGQAIDQALEDRSIIYVIDYYPRHNRWDGKLHKLEVRTARTGIRLRYRESYRATPTPLRTSQSEQQKIAAVASASLDFPEIQFSVEVQPKDASDPILVLHLPVEELQWSAEQGKMTGALQVWFVQKRASGEDVFNTHWKSDLHMPQDQYQRAMREGLSLPAHLKVQSSSVAKVRVLVADPNSGKVGSVDIPVASFTGSREAR